MTDSSSRGEMMARTTRPFPRLARRRTVLRLVFLIVLTMACRLWAIVRDDAIPAWVTERPVTEAKNNVTSFSQPSFITLESLKGIQREKAKTFMDTSTSLQEAEHARKPLLDILLHAGLQVDDNVMHLLPTWSQVEELYGSKPVIFGKHFCQAFRDAVPKEKRFVGVAGQMNTGTNALYQYLRQNMYIPENKLHNGILWTIPWYKHAWASLRYKYMYRSPNEHSNVLPVVMIRDPYFWMKSMCESPYSMIWNQSASHCPNLMEDSTVMDTEVTPLTKDLPSSMGVPVLIHWGHFQRTFDSLAHVWSQWYREYVEANFPRLMIRFEDLIFHTEDVLREIQDCVGAEWRHDQIVYPTAPAKTAAYFEAYKAQSGFVSALINYGQDNGHRTSTMTDLDRDYAESYLDSELMELFQYKHPDR